MSSGKRKNEKVSKVQGKRVKEDEEIQKEDFTVTADSTVDALTATTISTQTLSVSGATSLNSTTFNGPLIVNGSFLGSAMSMTGISTLNVLYVSGLTGLNSLGVTNNSQLRTLTTSGNATLNSATCENIDMGSSLIAKKLSLLSGPNEHEYQGFGTSLSTLRYHVNSASSDHVFYSATSPTASMELFRIKGNGNVGVNVAPTKKFHVKGDVLFQSEFANDDLKISLASSSETRRCSLLLGTPHEGVVTNALKTSIVADPTGAGGWSRANLHFCLNNTSGSNSSIYSATVSDSRMIITSPGNVGIGLASFTYPTEKLHVVGNCIVTGTLFLNSLASTSILKNQIWYNVNSSIGSYLSGPICTKQQAFPRYSRALAARKVSTWITRSTPATNQWNSVCWSPQLLLFVAVSSNGANRVMTSQDGIIWISRASSAITNWFSVCWSPDLLLFVAVANDANGTQVMTSQNGITWTNRTVPGNDSYWTCICWSSELSLFVVVANNGINRVMTSPDGITWTLRTVIINDWTSVCWSPDLSLFVAVSATGGGNCVMTSANGISWTPRTNIPGDQWKSVCWSSELSLFTAVGSGGISNGVMTSLDGISWSLRTTASSDSWNSVCWSPELSLFVAVASSGVGSRLITSSDGITWTSRTGVVDNWISVCWSSELHSFVAVSATGTIMTTTNTNIYGPLNINSASHLGACNIKQLTTNAAGNQTNENSSGILIERSDSTNRWAMGINGGNNFSFWYNAVEKGYFDNAFNVANIDFTGQHRSRTKDNLVNYKDKIGFIVSSTGEYNNLNDDNTAQVNEALPIVELSTVEKDSKVFGVIAEIEDDKGKRNYRQGAFVSVIDKNSDDTRLVINSVGEGAVYVCNLNGNINNGDYITTSNVSGIGQKQSDDILHSYTVAKATCSVDFNGNLSKFKISKFKYNNTTYTAVLIGVTYHCG